jgi:hypothetical protein
MSGGKKMKSEKSNELPRIHNRGDEKQPEPSLEELVSRIPESYKTTEVDWGMPVGREAWRPRISNLNKIYLRGDSV